MKKLFVVCLVICCSLIVFIPNTLGDVRPDENKTVILEGFDDLAAEDIGRTGGAVGSFDIHYELGYGDGKMQLVQTDVSRQGLALIPDYASGYNEGILRTTYYRLGSKNASAERAEALSEAWSAADGFRFYLKNNTDDNIYLSIPVFFTDRPLLLMIIRYVSAYIQGQSCMIWRAIWLRRNSYQKDGIITRL